MSQWKILHNHFGEEKSIIEKVFGVNYFEWETINTVILQDNLYNKDY